MNNITITPTNHKVVAQVNATINHDLFKKMLGNRPLKENVVLSLIENISKTGQITPILVNQQYEIIDGQHRLEACRRLNIEVKFIRTNGDLGMVTDVNNTQHKWMPVDYMESQIAMDNSHYRMYKQMAKDYPFLSGKLLRGVFDFSARNANREFNEGRFVVANWDTARMKAIFLGDVNRIYPLKNKVAFASGLLKLFSVEGYNPKQMLEKLKMLQATIAHCPTVDVAMRELERIYNYKARTFLEFRNK